MFTLCVCVFFLRVCVYLCERESAALVHVCMSSEPEKIYVFTRKEHDCMTFGVKHFADITYCRYKNAYTQMPNEATDEQYCKLYSTLLCWYTCWRAYQHNEICSAALDIGVPTSCTHHFAL